MPFSAVKSCNVMRVLSRIRTLEKLLEMIELLRSTRRNFSQACKLMNCEELNELEVRNTNDRGNLNSDIFRYFLGPNSTKTELRVLEVSKT